MKFLKPFAPVAAALLLASSHSLVAQQPPGGPPPGGQAPGQGPGGPGGPGGGRGGRGGMFGPQLPPEQQAEVDRIMAALEAETRAVTTASSNLVAITFGSPTDKAKITQANDELAKVRAAWAAKASKLVAETQASDKKLSPDAINRLVQMNSGGRGGPPGFGRGGPGGPGGPGGGRPPGGQP